MTNESIVDLKKKIKILEEEIAQTLLKNSVEKNLSELLKTSTDVFYSRNLISNKYDYITDSMFDILGYSATEFQKLPVEKVFNMIHPEDLETVKSFFNDFINYKEEEDKKFSIEYRIKHKKGHYVWVNENISMIRDGNLTPSHMVGNLRNVSKIKENEHEIQNQKSLIDAIFDNIAGSMWSVDNNYKFVRGNLQFKEEIKQGFNTKYKPGMNILSIVQGKEYNEWKAFYDKALSGHSFVFERERIHGKEGFWYEYHFTPVFDIKKKVIGATVVAYDITPRKLAENALLKSEEKFKQYTLKSPVGIYTADINGNCTYANDRWLKMAGMTMKEAEGKGWIKGLHPDDQLTIAEKWYKAVKSEGNWGYEYRFKNKQGKITWVYGMAVALHNKEEEVTGYLGTNIDITALKNAEKKLSQNNEKLKEINATKDKLFSIIAHDLKSPFSSIVGFSELLVKHTKNKQYSKIEKFSNIILQESIHSMDLLTNLLEWSRSQTGNIIYEPTNFNITKLIEEVIDLFEVSANQKQISFLFAKQTNIQTIADRNMIYTVLRNLISNAIKFTVNGGKIEIATKQNKKELIILVKDNGVGMSDEKIKKLFKVEETFSSKGTNDEKGTGLGLILCKEFIEKHQGKIEIESQEGKGSTFKIIIPQK